MNELTRALGLRIREYRLKAGFTQEQLAERAEVHPTYIGQVERGEKNLTVTSLSRICGALNVNLSEMMSNLEEQARPTVNFTAAQAYELFCRHTPREQQKMYEVLRQVESMMK